MKYTNCPQCNNKIIDRAPLRCLYCGYDSTQVQEEKLEPLDPPKRPNRDNYIVLQTLTLVISLVGAIAFLISLLYTRTTVVDGVIVELESNVQTYRWIFGISTVVAFMTFLTSSKTYQQDLIDYKNDSNRISEINQKIESGAKLHDFDEADCQLILKGQEEKKQQTLNQKTPTSHYIK